MTREEQIKICSVCKHRKMDMKQGMLCELTNTKADFDAACPNYDEDTKELEKNERIEQEYQETLSVSGWLAFFLWFGIGIGALMSCFMIVAMIPDVGYSFFGGLLEILSIICLVVIAILSIKAFYQKKSNAVALAKTYIAMIALDAVCCIINYILIKEPLHLVFAFRSLIWSAIWFSYLTVSTQVENMIPKAKRVWKKTEKIILGIYVLSCLLTVVMTVNFVNNPASSNLYDKEAVIDASIRSINTQLPDYSNPNATQLEIIKENDCIVYTYKINTETDTLNQMAAWESALIYKQNILSAVAVSENLDEHKMLSLYFSGGYNVCYRYLNAQGHKLYDILVNEDEYSNAKKAGVNFKCDEGEFQLLVDFYKTALPFEYMGNCSLINIRHSDSSLSYYVQLPRLSALDLTYVDADYLKKYLYEIWAELDDSLRMLATINNDDIVYHFYTAEGDEHCEVTITPEEYNAFDQ